MCPRLCYCIRIIRIHAEPRMPVVSNKRSHETKRSKVKPCCVKLDSKLYLAIMNLHPNPETGGACVGWTRESSEK